LSSCSFIFEKPVLALSPPVVEIANPPLTKRGSSASVPSAVAVSGTAWGRSFFTLSRGITHVSPVMSSHRMVATSVRR
jgi:hypothetical protein